MLILLSPSKNMDQKAAHKNGTSQPRFLNQSEQLIKTLRDYSVPQLMEFMGISENLARLNHQRFIDWNRPFTPENATPALLAFTGDVYEGLNAKSLNATDIKYAQTTVRILSGLYGLLRPLDLIQPYRLEMGRPLQTTQTKNLYEFWRTTITDALNDENDDQIINLASQEYTKAIAQPSLKKTIISPAFKDEKNGKLKTISFYAKRARGKMTRYLIENRISTPDELLKFSEDGYSYAPELSTPGTPVFTRPER